MIAEIQVLPSPAGTPGDRFAHVHAAIEVIAASGLAYEVGPLGTSVEGAADDVWRVARATHEACLAAGAERVITVLKLAEVGEGADPVTMGGLTDRYRS